MHVSHTGTSSLPTSHRSLLLKDVLVAPDLVTYLLYVRHFTIDNMCSIEFGPYGLFVKDLITKAELLRCNSSSALYPIFLASPAPLSPNTSWLIDLWHRRLSHPGDSTAFSQRFPCCNNADGCLCQICQLGKHYIIPVPPSISRSSFLFQLIHCDLWTSKIQRVSRNKYYLIITDDFSNYMWTFPLTLKYDVHEKFRHFHADEGMTPRSSILPYLVPAKEEARSKDT
jgi:hypothetical protein